MNSVSILQNLPQWLQATVLILGVLSTLAAAISGLFAVLAKVFPRVAFFDAAAKVVAVAGFDIAQVSAWLGGLVVAKKPDTQRGFASVRAMLFLLGFGIVAVSVSLVNGCAWWKGGGETTVVTDAEQIAAEALKGKSVEQIAIDLGIAVAEVLASLLGSLDAQVHKTRAYGEALKARATVLALPSPEAGK